MALQETSRTLNRSAGSSVVNLGAINKKTLAAFRRDAIIDSGHQVLCNKTENIYISDLGGVKHSQKVSGSEGKRLRGSFFHAGRDITIKYSIDRSVAFGAMVLESYSAKGNYPKNQELIQNLIEKDLTLIFAMVYVARRDNLRIGSTEEMDWLRDTLIKSGATNAVALRKN